MKVAQIEMTITLTDGTKVQGIMGPDIDSRWGADVRSLGHAVAPMEVMGRAMWDEGLWQDDEDEGEEE